MADTTPKDNGDLIARYGSAENALTQLRRDNARLREKNRLIREAKPGQDLNRDLEFRIAELEKENDELQQRQTPAGATVLGKEDAATFAALQALKKKPEELAAALTELETVRAQLAERTRREAVREVADATGLKASVLIDLVEAKGLHVEAKDQESTEGGKKVTRKVAMVRPAADEKAALVAIDAYDATKPYLPALVPEGGTRTAAGPTEFPAQRSTRTTGSATPTADELAAKKVATGAYSSL